jgi:uncharacterized protein (DUF2141 family)
MKPIFTTLFFLLIASEILAQNKEYSVHIHCTHIRNQKGTIRLGFFKSEDDFEKEKPFKRIAISKEAMTQKNLVATINVPEGTYGISALDDENDNVKMDYTLIGIPKEGFALSNHYHTGFSKPKLAQFLIVVNKNNMTIHMKMRYF